MANSKKRQASDYEGNKPSNPSNETVNNEIKGRGATSKPRRIIKKKQKKLSHKLWDTLPGELKNKIYELILVRGDTMVTNIGRKFSNDIAEEDTKFAICNDSMTAVPTYVTSTRWREPPLFRVSKDIRYESMGIYFGGNRLQFSIDTNNVAEAVFWIKGLAKRFDKSWVENWQIDFTLTRWSQIGRLSHIAELIYLYPSLPDTREQSERQMIAFWLRQLGFRSGRAYVPLWLAFKDMIEMTVKARYRGTEVSDLKQDLADWVLNKCLSVNPQIPIRFDELE